MRVNTDDIQAVINILTQAMTYADRFMYLPGEYITPDKLMYPTMRLCLGNEDQQIFHTGQPGSEAYNTAPLTALYEILIGIQKGMILPPECTMKNRTQLKGVIDLEECLRRYIFDPDSPGQLLKDPGRLP
jgi:hypothetical protein